MVALGFVLQFLGSNGSSGFDVVDDGECGKNFVCWVLADGVRGSKKRLGEREEKRREVIRFGEKLDVGILESEKRVEFVEESVEKVDKLREELLIQVADEIASRNEEIEIRYLGGLW
ncbi:hypothetical protein QYF36_015711 [Acer negundo]|nr:hypothetical protein QYF36_015711 [Acer negundo]